MTDFEAAVLATVQRMRAAAPAGLAAGLEVIAAESSRQVPKDTGALDESRQIEVDGERGVISYNTKYSNRQHEDLEYVHPHGGNAKYLENPVHSEAEGFFEAVAEAMRGAR